MEWADCGLGYRIRQCAFCRKAAKSVERGYLVGIPACRCIGARERLKTEFLVFVTEIPDGFTGVRDVRLEDGVPVVLPR